MKKIQYSSHQIHQRITELAKQISRDYEGQSVTLVGVLKGAMVFMSHLLVKLEGDFEIDTLTVSSYGSGTQSGELKLQNDLSRPVKGKTVLLVEDIIDSGKTLAFVQKKLMDEGAKSVEIVVFVDKESKENKLEPKYFGFKYKDTPFLVGFGFDLNEKYRNLPEVYQEKA